MSLLRSRPLMRWLVPVSAAVAVIGGGAAVGVFTASAEPSLPPRSAAQLLVDLQTARLGGLSGTVVQRADLGLPALPGLGAEGTDNLASLVAGSNTVRLWYAGPEQVRVAVLGTLGETDVIRNGADVWFWNSRTNEASHRVLTGSTGESGAPETGAGADQLPMTPQQAADRALAAVDPSTEVSVGRSATVAGRDAYELVLAPRDPASLVGQVRIAIDAAEHVPLRFELFARDVDKAAFEVAFTQVDFARPDPAQFVFNPPPGTTVTEPESSTGTRPDPSGAPAPDAGEKSTGPDGWRTVGSGWATVLIAQDSPGAASGADSADAEGTPAGGTDLAGLVGLLPEVSGEWGSGRLLAGNLFSVLVTDDGRLLAGAVAPERLYEVAGTDR